MTSLERRKLLKSRASRPPESQPLAWTLLPGAPQPPSIGHNSVHVQMLDGFPVNESDAPNYGPRDFALSESDCSKPDASAAPVADSIN